MTEWMVTFNVGGSFARHEVRAHALEWAQRSLESKRPAIVFAQEVPSDEWLAVWGEAGYEVSLGHDRQWKVRSALVTRKDLTVSPLSRDDFANLHYHGSYLAAARWSTRVGEVVLASVHASPNPAEPDRYGWRGQLPEARDGGGDVRYLRGERWDSDLVLATLGEMANSGTGLLIAAGDLNEALAFDLGPDGGRMGTWGKEFFQMVRDYGLEPWLHMAWGGERVTHDTLQLDHVLVTQPALALLSESPPPAIDDDWTLEEGVAERSDHAPVWVALNDQAFES